jgi:hypothetical protein
VRNRFRVACMIAKLCYVILTHHSTNAANVRHTDHAIGKAYHVLKHDGGRDLAQPDDMREDERA